MPAHATLAACVMAALPIPALLAQSQDTSRYYCYGPEDCAAHRNLQAAQTNAPIPPPNPSSPPMHTPERPSAPAIPACDSHSEAEAEDALDHAMQSIKMKAMPSAICWLNVAAAQNIPAAYGGLAAIYFKGTGGVPVDLKRALYYAEKAAEGNDSIGETIVSLMYETGQVLDKDPEKAKFWKEKAAHDKAMADAAYARALQSSTQQAAARAASIPAHIAECESHVCGAWSFTDNTGIATWPSGAIGSLTVERFSPDDIVITRRDTTGSTPGITAVYTGHMTGDEIDGDVTWTWPGHFNGRSPTGKWHARIVDDSEATAQQTQPDIRSLMNQPGPAGFSLMDLFTLFSGPTISGSSTSGTFIDPNRARQETCSAGGPCFNGQKPKY